MNTQRKSISKVQSKASRSSGSKVKGRQTTTATTSMAKAVKSVGKKAMNSIKSLVPAARKATAPKTSAVGQRKRANSALAVKGRRSTSAAVASKRSKAKAGSASSRTSRAA